MKTGGKVAIGCGVLFLCGASCVSYPIVKIRWATARVDAFCAKIHPGDDVAGIEQSAVDGSLEVFTMPAETTTPPRAAHITVWQGFVFARRLCTIEYADGRVTSTRTSSLD